MVSLRALLGFHARSHNCLEGGRTTSKEAVVVRVHSTNLFQYKGRNYPKGTVICDKHAYMIFRA